MSDRTGHPRLMSAVRKLGMRTGKSNQTKTVLLECQVRICYWFWRDWSHFYRVLASAYTQPSGLMNFIYLQGARAPKIGWIGPKKLEKNFHIRPFTWFTQQKKLSRKVLLGNGYTFWFVSIDDAFLMQKFQGGGTIFCRRKQWSAKNFPRGQFYDSKSKGGQVLMHSKVGFAQNRHGTPNIFCTKMIIAMLQDNPFSSKKRQEEEFSETEDDTDDEIQVVEPAAGWAYVGSHNFTPSAWGTLSGSSFNPILNVRHLLFLL